MNGVTLRLEELVNYGACTSQRVAGVEERQDDLQVTLVCTLSI